MAEGPNQDIFAMRTIKYRMYYLKPLPKFSHHAFIMGVFREDIRLFKILKSLVLFIIRNASMVRDGDYKAEWNECNWGRY